MMDDDHMDTHRQSPPQMRKECSGLSIRMLMINKAIRSFKRLYLYIWMKGEHVLYRWLHVGLLASCRLPSMFSCTSQIVH